MLSVRRMLARCSASHPGHRPAFKVRPGLESLESRVVPYTASGNMWPNPQLITISFMPDGTATGGGPSNLSSKFNGKSSLTGWQSVILKAAQTWAQVADINFQVVPDDGEPEGAGAYQQGNPNFGDIRIGGYNFGSSTLAGTMYPPSVNNYSIAGDVFFNTGMNFNIGGSGGFDLYTVAVHEIGHALGLDHSTSSTSNEMYPVYNGVKPSLSSDDIAGIQSIYGTRPLDVFEQSGYGGSIATAGWLNWVAPSGSTDFGVYYPQGLQLSQAYPAEYVGVTVPQGTNGNVTLTVNSRGISLLDPDVTVYAADGSTVLAHASGNGQDGTTVALTVYNITAGENLYIKVQGYDSSVFGYGAYELLANFAPTAGVWQPSSPPAPGQMDQFEQASYGGSIATAGWLNWVTPSGATNWGVYYPQGLQVNAAFSSEFLGLSVPQGTNGNFTLMVNSRGISQLDPTLTVYASDGSTVLGQATGGGQNGTTVALTVYNVTAGETLYLKVQGDGTAAGQYGAYNLLADFAPQFGIMSTANLDPPVANGSPLHGGGGQADSVPGHLHDGEFSDTFGATPQAPIRTRAIPHGPMTLHRPTNLHVPMSLYARVLRRHQLLRRHA